MPLGEGNEKGVELRNVWGWMRVCVYVGEQPTGHRAMASMVLLLALLTCVVVSAAAAHLTGIFSLQCVVRVCHPRCCSQHDMPSQAPSASPSPAPSLAPLGC
jgi:hypothetical protein